MRAIAQQISTPHHTYEPVSPASKKRASSLAGLVSTHAADFCGSSQPTPDDTDAV
jgi:hypothetical protein